MSTVQAIDELERVRTSPAAEGAKQHAPSAYANAEELRLRAREAKARGDDVGASLIAERAIASYSRAALKARIARASEEEARAKTDLTASLASLERYRLERARADREGELLSAKLAQGHSSQLTGTSGPADPKREAARFVAAKSLLVEAKLLCSAARLTSSKGPKLDEAEAAITPLEGELDKPRAGSAGPLIDRAARTREKCLAALTQARRLSAKSFTAGDVLFAELSAQGGFGPTRDERGVVISLKKPFGTSGLLPKTEELLKKLATIATSHRKFGVQVVIHDSDPSSKPKSGDARLVQAEQILVNAGVQKEHVRGELAGGALPLLDPASQGAAEQNARLEVIFVPLS